MVVQGDDCLVLRQTMETGLAAYSWVVAGLVWCVISWVFVIFASVLHDKSFYRFSSFSLMALMWIWSVWFRTQTVTIVSFLQTDGEVRAGASYLNTYRA